MDDLRSGRQRVGSIRVDHDHRRRRDHLTLTPGRVRQPRLRVGAIDDNEPPGLEIERRRRQAGRAEDVLDVLPRNRQVRVGTDRTAARGRLPDAADGAVQDGHHERSPSERPSQATGPAAVAASGAACLYGAITCAANRSISSSCGLHCSSSRSTPASSNARTCASTSLGRADQAGSQAAIRDRVVLERHALLELRVRDPLLVVAVPGGRLLHVGDALELAAAPRAPSRERSRSRRRRRSSAAGRSARAARVMSSTRPAISSGGSPCMT